MVYSEGTADHNMIYNQKILLKKRYSHNGYTGLKFSYKRYSHNGYIGLKFSYKRYSHNNSNLNN